MRTGAVPPVAVAAGAGAVPLIVAPRVAALFVEVVAGATPLTDADGVLAVAMTRVLSRLREDCETPHLARWC